MTGIILQNIVLVNHEDLTAHPSSFIHERLCSLLLNVCNDMALMAHCTCSLEYNYLIAFLDSSLTRICLLIKELLLTVIIFY